LCSWLFLRNCHNFYMFPSSLLLLSFVVTSHLRFKTDYIRPARVSPNVTWVEGGGRKSAKKVSSIFWICFFFLEKYLYFNLFSTESALKWHMKIFQVRLSKLKILRSNFEQHSILSLTKLWQAFFQSFNPCFLDSNHSATCFLLVTVIFR